MTTRRQRGRPPGRTETRQAILDAAVAQFAAHGYDGTSLRAVAAAAGVDQKLIAHYFESKHGLFAAAMEMPVDPAELLPVLLAGDRESLGERMAITMVGVLEERATRERLLAVIRAAASEPDVARTLREFLEREVLARAAEQLGPDAPRRFALCASQFVGLAMARHILAVGPLVDAPASELVAVLAPTFQRYLSE